MLFACVATAVVLKRVFDDSPGFKNVATEQMEMEFASYIDLKNPEKKLPVAMVDGTSYFAESQQDWSFLIHDKTLRIQAPQLTPAPAPAVQAQVYGQAASALTDFAKTWLVDKYHTQKDVLVEVTF